MQVFAEAIPNNKNRHSWEFIWINDLIKMYILHHPYIGDIVKCRIHPMNCMNIYISR